LEYPVRRNLELVLEHLQPLAPLQWSPSANFHITTKFIGEWPEDRLDELKAALRAIPPVGRIDLRLAGFGWYPNPHQPRVLFAGVHAPEALRTLAAATASACESIGIAQEARAYSPHLTLARIRERADLVALRQAIAQLPSAEFGLSQAAKFLLYKSKPNEDGVGSTYTVMGEFEL
jgi:RNA 2',3'-cyclic 3'-phosphodiesterase